MMICEQFGKVFFTSSFETDIFHYLNSKVYIYKGIEIPKLAFEQIHALCATLHH